jgi:hypothetical protein
MSPLPGLILRGSRALPPLPRWATIGRPFGVPTGVQIDDRPIHWLDRSEGGAV